MAPFCFLLRYNLEVVNSSRIEHSVEWVMQRTENTRELWRTLWLTVSQVTTTDREAELTIEYLNTTVGVVGIQLSPRLDVSLLNTCWTREPTKGIQVREQRSIVVIKGINVTRDGLNRVVAHGPTDLQVGLQLRQLRSRTSPVIVVTRAVLDGIGRLGLVQELIDISAL